MANLIETPKWEDGIYQLEKTDPVVGGADGISNRQAKQLANRTSYLKSETERLDREKAPTASPSFTGTPTAPTAAQNINSNQIATTAFVKTAIANLVGNAPEALDTLVELAKALGDDANLKQTLLSEIGKKANLTDLNQAKNQLDQLRTMFVGVPIPYPLATPPSGFLIMMGQTFSKTTYPILAQRYPSGRLPDMRGEFIRGWDNGRGVDRGRSLLTTQGDAIRDHFHYLPTQNGSNDKLEDGIDCAIGDGSDVSVSVSGKFFLINDLPSNSRGNNAALDNRGGRPRTYSARINNGGVTASENRVRNIAFNYICFAA
ncbi:MULTISPECIES: phage tail protein [Rodentibacter]|uniref:phage tail protein n=1 Tax=Rodentibacter TaxID=1960084 RepID=UPI001CFE70A1|nr:phage tail protein [Rodentibacter sp. JRC1]GJI55897.1 tail fiber protein [Rodentibacter sp. JRC1]